MASNRRRRKQRRMSWIPAIIFLAVVIVAILLLTGVAKKYTPSDEQSDYRKYYGLHTEQALIVAVDDKACENGLYMDGRAYLTYDTVHDTMNSRFFWDGTEQVLRYALPDTLITIGPDSSTYTVGRDRVDAGYTICTVQDDTMYLAVDFVKEYTDIRYKVYEEPNRIMVSTQWGQLSYSKVKKSAQVREDADIKSPIVTELTKGDLVQIAKEDKGWSFVCTEDGFTGYIKSDRLGGEQMVECESTFEDVTYRHISRDFDINMVWHQVTNQTMNDEIGHVLETTPGINVISPTWFYINDNNGGIKNLASSDYVNACHTKGVEVWALVSNLENPDVDVAAVLNTTSSRDNLVNQLISAALRYDLDGINVDFESMEDAVGDGYIQFVRELSLKCADNGIVLSVDNPVPSNYSREYQRTEEARFADYVVVMAYDEHYSGSDPGSVASIGFVRQGIEDTLQEVPAAQVILGIPLYTRAWELTPSEEAESGYTVSSKAISMAEVDTRIAVNDADMTWLEDVGQYYVEYVHEGRTYQIWMEEQNSIEEKMRVFVENDLAGVSFWKSGMEKANIWDAVKEYIE